MPVIEVLETIMLLLGGLGAFLAGMEIMSESMSRLAHGELRRMLNKTAGNRFAGVGIGAAVTMIIQSSSATTVMVVGLVNAGILTLFQATAIIMGANIGTTITAWIASLGESGRLRLPAPLCRRRCVHEDALQAREHQAHRRYADGHRPRVRGPLRHVERDGPRPASRDDARHQTGARSRQKSLPSPSHRRSGDGHHPVLFGGHEYRRWSLRRAACSSAARATASTTSSSVPTSVPA